MSRVIVQKAEVVRLVQQLDQSVYELKNKLGLSTLRAPSEGCKSGFEWKNPAAVAATFGSIADVRIAAASVIGVVGEIKRLKPAGTALMAEARQDAKPVVQPTPRSYRDHLPE